MYKISFFVPIDFKDKVKEAMFVAGAGKIGHYERCSWEILGTGQFQAKTGASPFLGEINKLEIVSEYKVEMVCEKDLIKKIIQALKESHPYETPAYEVIELLNI